ncbi:hypothetical protein [Streptomyces sp. VRA16 Mangrove soil]|uniref:hypothetical protein n=1 Tax=Streptomyces sp. VRA16 Mangrove soil TaxID=2817434 RepID=UPI001A9F3666|nr:hypothetical protein [Streptomyces sp. VRA16 Mangrove soil]MBO1330869.1 hypothetical protein [Streptomyces sp. VRA16 Mangrove soil]
MSIPWRSSAAEFERILGRRGALGGVCDMEAAWGAFEEFAQVPVEGVAGPEEDGDGLIVQWGTWDRGDRDGTYSGLSFGRQLAVDEGADRSDPYWQPGYWQVEFRARFADDAAPGHQPVIAGGDSGFDFAALGAPRAAALAALRRLVDWEPALSALWRAAPVSVEVTLDQAC